MNVPLVQSESPVPVSKPLLYLVVVVQVVQALVVADTWAELADSQVALVAAHNGDLLAASKCGLRTAFVRRMEYGPGQTSEQKAEHNFDFVAESFEDLATRLGV